MDVEFQAPQVRALLQLLHFHVPEQEREYELPIWFNVNVDDVERVLCGETVPDNSRGRPHKTRGQVNRDYRLADEVSKLLGLGEVNSVAEAARELVAAGAEALPPDLLARLVREAVEAEVDMKALQRIVDLEEIERAQAIAAMAEVHF